MTDHRVDRQLLLVRHSAVQMEKSRPANEWSLSPEGREHCRQFEPLVSHFKPDLFITSQENKAIETGMLLAKAMGVPLQNGHNLHEQERLGVPFYPDLQDFHNEIARLFATPDRLVFGQETANQACERFNTAIRKLIECYGDQKLAIVTHGTVMTLLVKHYNPTIDPMTFWRGLKQPCALLLGIPDMVFQELILP